MTHSSDIFSGLNLSNVPDGEPLLQRYVMWFERYPQCAQESLRQRLANGKSAVGAWFELLLHELIFQLGCKVHVADIDNTEKAPDFLVSHGRHNCYVEATTVNPGDNPSVVDPNLEDAISKLNTLDYSEFQVDLSVEGKISRTLSKKELINTFGKLLSEHDPVMVREQIDSSGEYGAPYIEIKGKDWVLRGELRPAPPEGKQHTSPGLTVYVGGSYSGDASREVQDRVSKKAKKYNSLDAPLIVAVNVLDIRFDREAEAATLFGQEQIRYFPNHPEIPDQLVRKPDGVWVKGGYKPRYTRLAGVIMFNGFLPWSPRGSANFYINPFGCNTDLPQPLFRLRHAIGEEGRLKWVEGIDIEIILATK